LTGIADLCSRQHYSSMLYQLFSDPWVKDHQTLIAAFFGLIGSVIAFTALLVGYLVNASLNRRQLDRNRHQDAVSLAAMLAAEINVLGAYAEAVAKTMSHDENIAEDSFVLDLPQAHYFQQIKDRVGLLGPSLAMSVTNFYSLYLLSARNSSSPSDLKEITLPKQKSFVFSHSSKALQKLKSEADYLSADLIKFTFNKYQPPTNIHEFLVKHSRRDAQVLE
jgi:hypothetical protein